MVKRFGDDEDSLMFAGTFTGALVPTHVSDGLEKAFKTGIGMTYKEMSAG